MSSSLMGWNGLELAWHLGFGWLDVPCFWSNRVLTGMQKLQFQLTWCPGQGVLHLGLRMLFQHVSRLKSMTRKFWKYILDPFLFAEKRLVPLQKGRCVGPVTHCKGHIFPGQLWLDSCPHCKQGSHCTSRGLGREQEGVWKRRVNVGEPRCLANHHPTSRTLKPAESRQDAEES